MATIDQDESGGNHAGQEIPVGGENPVVDPLSTNPSRLHGVGTEHNTLHTHDPGSELAYPKGISLIPLKNDMPAMEEDQLRTPKLEQPPLVVESIASKLSEPSQSHNPVSQQGNEEDIILSSNSDYFAQKAPQEYIVSDISRTPSSSNVSSIGLSGSTDSQLDTTSTPVSPESRASAWKDYVPSFNAESNRPVSVPNFHSKAMSRRREGPDYPNYPDQSFKALQSQHYPPPYQPGDNSYTRTRSSRPSQNSSFASSDDTSARSYPHIPSGAKTVGNTPAQSPGLFIPTLSKKHRTGEPDEPRSGTPMLHPAHLQAPKETNKLLKDIDPISGRKTINHYELYDKLGAGNHGTVKLARDLYTDTLCAVKIVRRISRRLRLGRSSDPNEMIKKEVAILKKARHPNVVSLLEVIDDNEWGKVYLALEYVERGEIIWRKPTDRDVALFEMHRCEREMAHGLSDDHERAAIEAFNYLAPSKRYDKARQTIDYQNKLRKGLERGGSQPEALSLNFDPYFSLEYAGESDNEPGIRPVDLLPDQAQSNAQPANTPVPLHATDDSSQSETPTQTPKPAPHSADTASTHANVLYADEETLTPYEGAMLALEALQDDDLSNDVKLQLFLNEIILGQHNWDAIDENFRYVPCLTLGQALDAFRDTVLGLEYLHYQGIIHRDIKPANLLWTTDFHVKISDFGVSYLGKPIREDDNHEDVSEFDEEVLDEAIELAKTVGTPAFYAPELCDPRYFEVGRDCERPTITGQIDVWALGVTLYAMVFGRLPFFHRNQFVMYEKIARDDVFIPRMRLKGVPHAVLNKKLETVKDRRKRFDDILEYEDVDDELRDLLKRLLEKKPSKRITLKEVKHHPWVLQGITDRTLWIDKTDPSLQSQGKKIEVSTQEVQDSIAPLTVLDRFKAGFQRVGSVLRGRGSQNRKRTTSNPKSPDAAYSAAAVNTHSTIKDERRSSLRGDEQILPALRASRENSEHPLAHSVTASPEMKNNLSYFDDNGNPLRPASDPQANRPVYSDRTLSTADSMKTIRAPVPVISRENSPNASSPNEGFSSPSTTVVDPTPTSSSSLSNVFAGAGRRFVNSMRSRERGVGGQSPSHSSRSSSIGDSTEDFHASPSLALSPAIAAGHVNLPPALREGLDAHPVLQDVPSEAFRRAQEQNYRRHTYEHAQRMCRPPAPSTGADFTCPPSPDDEVLFSQLRPTSVADTTSTYVISSSSDQIGSGDSTAHSRIPSVVSGASSLSVPIEEDETRAPALKKTINPLIIGQRSGSRHRGNESEWSHPTPSIAKVAAERAAAAAVDDDLGYTGEGEQDSDSEDEGLAMA